MPDDQTVSPPTENLLQRCRHDPRWASEEITRLCENDREYQKLVDYERGRDITDAQGSPLPESVAHTAEISRLSGGNVGSRAGVAMERAADEIERLSAENEPLRGHCLTAVAASKSNYEKVLELTAALQAIRAITGQSYPDGPEKGRPYTALSQIDQIARKALA